VFSNSFWSLLFYRWDHHDRCFINKSRNKPYVLSQSSFGSFEKGVNLSRRLMNYGHGLVKKSIQAGSKLFGRCILCHNLWDIGWCEYKLLNGEELIWSCRKLGGCLPYLARVSPAAERDFQIGNRSLEVTCFFTFIYPVFGTLRKENRVMSNPSLSRLSHLTTSLKWYYSFLLY
jgi:hypothetical protein